MSQNTVKKVHLIYGIILSVLILAVGVCLVLSCLDIYHSGSRPFSREAIATHFDAIKIPVYLTLAAVLGGVVLSIALPLENARPRAMRDDYETLKRLRRAVGSAVSGKERMLRTMLRCGTAFLSVACFVYPAVYFLDASRFGREDINESVISALVPTAIASAITLVLVTLCAYLCRKSVAREIAACKEAVVSGRTASAGEGDRTTLGCIRTACAVYEKPIRLVARLALFAVAVVFIVLGVLNGGIDDVLGKAIRICTECIGLG